MKQKQNKFLIGWGSLSPTPKIKKIMKRENKRYINFVRKEIQNELDIFQSFFSTPIFEKKVVYKDGDKIYICFRDNEKFLEKFNQNFYKDLKRKILISIRSKLIRDKKFKLKRLVNFEKQNITAIIYETL